MPEIEENVPNDIFPRGEFNIPKDLQLADPRFHLPNSIDLFIRFQYDTLTLICKSN